MRKLLYFFTALACLVSLAGCKEEPDFIDFSETYDEAILMLPDGSFVRGTADSWAWTDYGYIAVNIDGETYLASSTNYIMLKNS